MQGHILEKRSFLIGVPVLLQLLGQLLTQLLIVRIIGVGGETDAYIAAQTVPLVFGAVITTTLQSVWLPRFSVLSKDLRAWRQEQAVAQGQSAILGGGVMLLLWLSVGLWLPPLFPGLSDIQHQDATEYCGILLLAAVCSTQSALLTVALRARNQFVIAEWVAAAGTLFSLGAMYFALPVYGVVAAAWVSLARAIIVYAVQLYLAGWPSVSVAKGLRYRDTWGLMRPLLFGTSIYKTSPMVDRYWASQAPVGGITTLTLAQTAIGSLAMLLERVQGMPLMPTLARLASEKKYEQIRKIYRSLLVKATLLVVSLFIILHVAKVLVVGFISDVFFVHENLADDVWLFAILLLGHLYAAIVGSVLVSIFYALNDTRTPVYIGILGFLFGLVLKWLLFGKLALAGLAIATSCYFLLNIVFFVGALERKLSPK